LFDDVTMIGTMNKDGYEIGNGCVVVEDNIIRYVVKTNQIVILIELLMEKGNLCYLALLILTITSINHFLEI